MFGIALVNLSASSVDAAHKVDQDAKASQALGLFSVFLACCSSGFAGVYFELQLKSSNADLWVRNVQMGVFSIVFSFMGVLLSPADVQHVAKYGWLAGYGVGEWMVVANQALGGLVVAVVVKYADNIMKGFATSVSIVVSSLISAVVFDFQPTSMFMVGAVLVMMSVYIYGGGSPVAVPRKLNV